MTYSNERRPFGGDAGSEKISIILRSQFQDITRLFNDERIKVLFPEKIVDSVDIGKIAQKWARTITTTLRFYKNQNKYGVEIDADKEFDLLFEIYMLYHKGINLDKSRYWHLRWMEEGIPAFTRWLDSFPATARGATADKLEKTELKGGRSENDVQW